MLLDITLIQCPMTIEDIKIWVKEKATDFLNAYDKSINYGEINSENEHSESIFIQLTNTISKMQNEVDNI